VDKIVKLSTGQNNKRLRLFLRPPIMCEYFPSSSVLPTTTKIDNNSLYSVFRRPIVCIIFVVVVEFLSFRVLGLGVISTEVSPNSIHSKFNPTFELIGLNIKSVIEFEFTISSNQNAWFQRRLNRRRNNSSSVLTPNRRQEEDNFPRRRKNWRRKLKDST